MSKTTGLLRGFDKAGRFVLPAEMVKTLELSETDMLEISCDGTQIVLRKHIPFCVLCGRQDITYVPFRNRKVCQSCAAEVVAAVKANG